MTNKSNTFKKKQKKDTKIIAFYLPQFHEVQENNKWWGKGFTEWSNTKKAKPLFNNHYQPREPYRDFYYDLTNPGVREWQANLAKKYGIYGFCYYHYWFKGRRLLERPFNEVLASGKPDFPFCLSWANEPWTRNWNGGSRAILMPQNYGDKKDWKEHFNYLIKAFKDDRYICVGNKPLFVIYRPELIPNLINMMDYWDKLAKQQGLEGIYFVQTFNGFRPLAPINRFDAAVEFEPHFTLAHGRNNNFWRKIKGFSGEKKFIDYDRIWESILNRNTFQHKKLFLGAFNDWDNTARMQASGTIYHGASPTKFKSYLSRQIYRAKNVYDSEFLFINAWNEWAEGAYLEPDKRYKYCYLEAVSDALKINN
ncbi:glycoside hydrolase family 99-like domain-containing protein [Oceanobacillus kimchii]|uniref:glycoside hydrolase family 99-like domain-containing protein n=1 Tax=Oceanobacillus kimchii TaxID=746691 RepID=UPI00232C7631|nr:glycoside hydrolase family 99-like domain-containing protein [Oceanobacillus kimchii]